MEVWIGSFIEEFVKSHHHDDIFRKPIVGQVSAHDPSFQGLKTAVHATHRMPHDFLPAAESVIAFFLPFSRRIIDSNRTGNYASRAWVDAYIRTNHLIEQISEGLKRELEKAGYESVTIPATHQFDQEILMSRWSHRHVAYLCGIGNFGRNHMLITDSGCCGRLGSLITTLPHQGGESIPHLPTCLYHLDGSCGLCIDRCEAKALQNEDLDRFGCYAVCLENARRNEAAGVADVCGKCLVGLPCSEKNPCKEKAPA